MYLEKFLMQKMSFEKSKMKGLKLMHSIPKECAFYTGVEIICNLVLIYFLHFELLQF